jgi:predicted transcriptional regulator
MQKDSHLKATTGASSGKAGKNGVGKNISGISDLDRQITDRLVNLNTSQKKVILSVVKGFTREEENWWNEVEDAARESIAKGLKQVGQGKVTPHKEVMKRYKKWLSK